MAALGTGLASAGYSTVDGVGVRASGTPLGYIAWLMLLQGLAIPAYAYCRRRSELVMQIRPFAVRGLLGAALSVIAYGLVLWANTRPPLAPIAALRESSIKLCPCSNSFRLYRSSRSPIRYASPAA